MYKRVSGSPGWESVTTINGERWEAVTDVSAGAPTLSCCSGWGGVTASVCSWDGEKRNLRVDKPSYSVYCFHMLKCLIQLTYFQGGFSLDWFDTLSLSMAIYLVPHSQLTRRLWRCNVYLQTERRKAGFLMLENNKLQLQVKSLQEEVHRLHVQQHFTKIQLTQVRLELWRHLCQTPHQTTYRIVFSTMICMRILRSFLRKVVNVGKTVASWLCAHDHLIVWFKIQIKL